MLLGPALEFFVDGRLPGTRLDGAAGRTVEIMALARCHPAIGVLKRLTIVGNDGVLRESVNTDGREDLEITFDQKIERNQWLVASAVCENGAVAHTTPVYVLVDGRPWFCPKRGPAIIDRQLQAIDAIAKEFNPAAGRREKGIQERLDRARKYYADLRDKMR